MPPAVKVSRQHIIDAALCIVRQSGEEGLNARAVAKQLGCSTQPVFSNYKNMALLRQDVIAAADGVYQQQIARSLCNDMPYLQSGLAYVHFAKEEPMLFRLLFMRNRTGEQITKEYESVRGLTSIIMARTGMDEEQAYNFHMVMWVFVHGIATMVATGFVPWDEAQIKQMLQLQYKSVLAYVKAGGTVKGDNL